MTDVTTSATTSTATGPRPVDPEAFRRAYDELVIGNHFFEAPSYYVQQRRRYERTLRHIAGLSLPPGSRVLEIGGGQMTLLCQRLFGHECVLADIGEEYADAVTDHGIDFQPCDLPFRDHFDLVVLCEVIEHMPVPPHIVLGKIGSWIRPGGWLLLTTPNLYRIRNAVRLALGMKVFGHYFYPERGQSLGHPVEYTAEHMRWQLERAGFEAVTTRLEQLSNVGATPLTRLARWAVRPLQLRPLWRDSIVATARRAEAGPGAAPAAPAAATVLAGSR